MKKRYIVLIVLGCVIFFLFISSIVIIPFFFNDISTSDCNIEFDSYRLVKDDAGNDIIILKYNLENNGKYITCFANECYLELYQNGVGLIEAYDLPQECHYNSEDQCRNLKGGASYEIEVAYELTDTTTDVEVILEDYKSFKSKTKTEIISISE